MSHTDREVPLVLVTGVTGYIGGRLVPRLLEVGYRVRCFVRDAARLEQRSWRERVEVVEGDVLEPDTLPAALQGVHCAYERRAENPYREGGALVARSMFLDALDRDHNVVEIFACSRGRAVPGAW